MLYTLLLLFLLLLIGILGMLGTRKVILDKMKQEIMTSINGENNIYLKLDYEEALVANTSLVNNFTFSPLDIASVVDKNGNTITTASISYESKPTFDSTKNGVYEVTYTGTYQGKNISKTTTIEIINPVSYDYRYAEREQTFETPTNGLYQIELWGAGGSSYFEGTASKGAYTSGNIELEEKTPLYVRVGGSSGYNGGGNTEYKKNGASAGGATDIRLNPQENYGMMIVNNSNDCRKNVGNMCISKGSITQVDSITVGQNEILYGPYKSYKAGVYLVTLTGTNLHLGTYSPYVYSSTGNHNFTITPVAQGDVVYKYLLYLEKDYDNVELYMKNTTTSNITVTSVTIENIGSRIMVAAGGSGSERVNGADGGALTGIQATGLYSTATANGGGATQTSGGTAGTGTNTRDTYGKEGYFGVGGFPGTVGYDFGGAGGGGYYGGGSTSYASAGGSGSSFISGYSGCDAIAQIPNTDSIRHTGQPNHYSGYIFKNTVMKAGNETIPNYDHTTTMTGNSGNGYASITPLIIEGAKVARNLVNNGGFEEEAKNWSKSVNSVSNSFPSSNNLEKSKVYDGLYAIHLNDVDTTNNTSWQYNKFNASLEVHDYLYIQSYIYVETLSSDSFVSSAVTYYKEGSGGMNLHVLEGNSIYETTSRYILNSRIQRVSTQFELMAQIGIKGTGSAYIDNIMVLNLTEIYGKGNEPDKAWCDENIKYFDGTWIVPNYK